MRIKLLTVIILLIPFLSFSQSPMSVSSFERMDNDMDARITSPKKDQNGKTCAIVKIETTLPLNEFTFDGGISGVIETRQEKGEIWLYQSPGTRYITIKHENHTPLRQYQYSEPLQEATVYVMKLLSATKVVTYEESASFQYLIIQCNIPGSRISINNREAESFTDGLFKKRMEFGKYSYEIKAPMYLPFVGQFELKTNKENYEIKADLIPTFAEITINSLPEQGAELIINNEYRGKTPIVEKMIIGKHELLLTQPMYKSTKQEIIIEFPQPQTLNVTMQPMFANIEILADESSDIYVNDEYKNIGSWKGRLVNGSYKLEARKESHQSSFKTIEVEEGKDLQIKLSNPIPILGMLDIDCISEIGANIYIDNKHYGKTPKIIEGLLIGQRQLRVEKEGFETYEKTLNIEQGKLTELRVKLKTGYSPPTISTDTNIIRNLSLTEQFYQKHEVSSVHLCDFSFAHNGDNAIYSLAIASTRINKFQISYLNFEIMKSQNNLNYVASDVEFPSNWNYGDAYYYSNYQRKVVIAYAPVISYLIPITKDINISPLIKYSFAWTRDTIDYKESKFLVASSISNELSFGLSLQFLLIKRLPIDLFTEYRKRIGGSESLKISEGFYFGIRLGWAILNDN